MNYWNATQHNALGQLSLFLFAIALAVCPAGCGDKSTANEKPGPAEHKAAVQETAPAAQAANAKPAVTPAEGIEMLTPTEVRAVKHIYASQAKRTINAGNAEAMVNALAREIEADTPPSLAPTSPAPAKAP